MEDILEDTLESLTPAMIVSEVCKVNILRDVDSYQLKCIFQSAVKVTDFDIGVHAPKIQMLVFGSVGLLLVTFSDHK